MTRRSFLSAALLSAVRLRQAASGGRDARLVGTVPLGLPGGRIPPFGQLLGSGLDARLFTDLSTLADPQSTIRNPQSALITSTDRFFVRTACPSAITQTDPWTVRVDGVVEAPLSLDLRSLEPLAVRGPRCLIECSGNVDQSNYGLMSTADWEGIPLPAVLERGRPTTGTSHILVSGVDDDTSPGRTSMPGASWIFRRDDLERALLATRMNGAPLSRDHGAPVRLLVPGWYGCACIKWVNRIEFVADDAPATSQMVEFAARTHQDPVARLAREFVPAVVDTAAMPVRIEKWRVGDRVEYRIAGIIWGGSKPTNALSIRFKSGQSWVRVDDCPLPASTLTWSFWSHVWRPDAPGRYQIVLRVDDPTVRTRRLDIFFYVREITIDEI